MCVLGGGEVSSYPTHPSLTGHYVSYKVDRDNQSVGVVLVLCGCGVGMVLVLV